MSNSVVYILELRDKFSQVAEQINRSTEGMTRKFDKAASRVKAMGDQMRKSGSNIAQMGSNLKWLSAASGLLAYSTVSDWGEAQAAMAKVDNALKATGGKAGLTLKQLTDESNRLMATSLFDDDVILDKSTNQLLKFGNVTGDVFLRAQQAAVNVAASTGKDLGGVALRIGQALNDPAEGFSRLSKMGVMFTPIQEKVMKTLVKTGRTAQAQAMILAQLEGKYKGAAAAAAAAGLGPVTQLNNSLGESKEIIGGLLAEALLPLATKLKDLSDKFQNANPRVQQAVALLLVLGTVIAPLLITIGFMATGVSALATVFSVLAGAVALVTWPMVAIGLAIVAVIAVAWVLYDNWQAIWEGIGASVAAVVSLWDAFVAKIKQGGEFVMKVLGIGETSPAAATTTPEAAANRAGANNAAKGTKDTVEVTINAPEGTVKEVKQGGDNSTGKKKMKVGVNAVR